MVNDYLTKWFGKSWRTSLAGYAAAIGNVVIPLIQGGHPTWKQILSSAGIAMFGALVKDAKVAGVTFVDVSNVEAK